MTPEVIAALLGAGLAGLAAIVVQLVAARLARSATNSAEKAGRIAEYLASTHSGVLAVGRLARLDHEHKDAYQTSTDFTSRVDRVNNILNAIQLLDTEPVIRAALEVNACLVTLEYDAVEKQWDRDVWREHRKMMDTSVDNLVLAGRNSLGRRPFNRSKVLSDVRATVTRRKQRSVSRPGSSVN